MHLSAADIDLSESVVFKLFVNNQIWGNITVLCDSTDCYIDLSELLNQLEYAYELQPEENLFKGFVSNTGDFYTIRHDSLFLDSLTTNDQALWSDDGEVYLKSNHVYALYGIQTKFTMSALSLNLITTRPIPAILRQQRQARKEKLIRERDEKSLTNIDTLTLHNLKINAIGYNISPYFASNNSTNWAVRSNINGELLKGSFIANYNYSSFDRRQWNNNFTFEWNKSIRNNKLIKTVSIYHDYTDLVTTTYGYASAVSISNEKRNSYLDRNYAYQGKTTPDTEVEIYNNGTLIQYVRSDSLGHYEVEIPTFGGDNKIVAISYDSFGLPVSSEELIYLPPNMQAKGNLGYRLTVGYTDDGRLFITPMFAYGLTKFMTLSASNETVFNAQHSSSIALLGLKLALTKKLRLDLGYAPTLKWSATLSANIGRILNGNLTYERFDNNQTIVKSNPQQRLLLNFNGDLPFKSIRGNYYLSTQYYKYPFSESFSTYLGIYFWWRKILTNLSISTASDHIRIEGYSYSARFGYNFSPRLYNELSADYQTSRSELTLRDRVNYQFKNELVAFLETSYGFGLNRYNVSLGLTWRLPWAQVKSGMFNSKSYTSGYMGISGSAIFHDHKVAFSDRYVAGSSLLIAMYIDKNGNKVYDKDEPIYKDASIVLHTSAEEKHTDKGVLYTNIPAHRPFKVIIPQQSFPDITWQNDAQQFCLMFSSYQSRSYYIPVRVISEVSGRVYTVRNGQKVGVNTIAVTITNTQTYTTTTIKTDEWGYYNYMGLTCGTYKIGITPTALASYKLKKEGVDLPLITIEPSLDGQQIDLLNIELKSAD